MGGEVAMAETRERLRDEIVNQDSPQPWRRTGRTTAMLRKVIGRLVAGERVLVLVANRLQVTDMARALQELPLGRASTAVRFVAVGDDVERRIAGLRFESVFVDHSAWEIAPSDTARAIEWMAPKVVRGA